MKMKHLHLHDIKFITTNFLNKTTEKYKLHMKKRLSLLLLQ